MPAKNLFKTTLILTFSLSLLWGFNLQANQQFKSGAQTSSPPVGVSFKIPEGFTGTYNEQVGGLIVQDSTVTLAVFGISQGEVETAGDIVVDLLRELGIQLQVSEVTRSSPKTLDATFSAWVDGQPKAMAGTIRQGSHENIIAVVGLSQPGKEDAIESAINEITDSLEWSQPQGGKDRHKLFGKALYRSGGSSDGYSGTGGFSAVTSQKEQIDLCSNGKYRFQSVSESFISTETASMPGSSKDGHEGDWWLVADLGGNNFLYLESNLGEYYIWPIYETANGANVNGNNFTASQSQVCY